MRAVVQVRRFPGWQKLMLVGFFLWLVISLRAPLGLGAAHGLLSMRGLVSLLKLLTGLFILQGACEALMQSVERLGARLRWNGYVAGTLGEILSTLPELVFITLVVRVEPLAAFIIAVATIYNNALFFSVYSFFLPKDQEGKFVMPPAITKAGTEVLIAGAGICLTIGLMMLGLRTEVHKEFLGSSDLIFTAVIMFTIFGFYLYSLIRYYAGSEEEHLPADPHTLGHPTDWKGILGFLLLGIVGSVLGGESVSSFAEDALHAFRLPPVVTGLMLAFFAGISEYVIVFKAHRRGDLGIALSNVFGGITQVMFLVVPYTFLMIGLFNLLTGDPRYVVPIDFTTTSIMVLLFPLFFVLLQYIEEDHTLSNLDAAAMTGIYLLLIYVLVFSGTGG
ncbi:MAG: sodium/calcium exchanger protein [Deltaproteobacteria bacterium]|nr:sodium/calcium exchanger protein [Deltaproteobacteria bacterium]